MGNSQQVASFYFQGYFNRFKSIIWGPAAAIGFFFDVSQGWPLRFGDHLT